jgi:PAS domain S-box-containing protein
MPGAEHDLCRCAESPEVVGIARQTGLREAHPAVNCRKTGKYFPKEAVLESCFMIRPPHRPRRLLPILLAWILPLLLVRSALALDKAVVQLKWLHHYQFAGYYAALEKGFYREAGLDVTLVEGGPNVEVEKEVVSGRADFGVGTSSILLHRAHGEDLVVVGQVFQHSPAIFLTPRKTGIRTIADMKGRRFMYSNQHGDMLAVLKKNGIGEEDIEQVPHEGDPADLLAGKADVMIAYTFNEPFLLERAGEGYFAFSPMTYGIDFYGDNFFTTRGRADARPDFVRRFREATLRGWRYALEHKPETVDILLSKYSRKKDREWLLFEANQIEPLIQPMLFELGYQNPSRWRHIADTFAELGMLPRDFDPTPVIHVPRTVGDYKLPAIILLVAAVIIAALARVLLTFRRLHRDLSGAHRDLVRSETQLRAIFEGSMAGILLIDPDGRLTVVNTRMAELFACPPEALVGTWYPDLVHPDQRHMGKGLMRQILAGEIDRVQTERLYLRKDGGTFWGYISVRRHNDADGKLVSLVCHLADITEIKRAEAERARLDQQLLHAQKLESLGVLAGGIAHDFNNILAGILGNVSFARRFIPPEDRAASILAEAEKASRRAAGLALQLLTFAKGGDPVKKVVAAGELVRESASLVLSGSRVRCDFRIPDDLRSIEVDEGQIGQVFGNIVLNASQAMPGGGMLVIEAVNATVAEGSAPPPGEYVLFRFTDQGCGIPPEAQKRIFDPYFTTKEGGNGLGLASSWSIVGKHGGHIGVLSEPGKGTTFEVWLPATDRAPAPPEAEDAQPEPSAAVGRTILVMDDEPMIRDLAANMLSELGYIVQTCDDGREAVALWKAALDSGNPFSAVVMDLTIPGGMGGKEAAQRILEIDPGALLVVSSGYSNDPVLSDYSKFGFRAAMVKPYDMREIARVLSGLFSPPPAR